MTFREWFRNHLADSARDIAEHGADSGFPHITYTSDTVKLFDQFGDEIWEMLVNDASDCGDKNVCQFIAGFRRDDMMESLDQFKNLLVWYACEKVASELAEQIAE
ncbi:MAG TPA: hypothetical protein VGU20_13970 [Stellaceae bacterium]|nr:hypothetical protein [Stellaceae bacterium]